MIDWLASKILISFYKTNFFLNFSPPFWIFKKFQNLESLRVQNLEFQNLRVCWVQKQCSKVQNFGLSTNMLLSLKMHPSCLTLLALSIFNLPCALWGIIIFEQVISLYWNFQGNFILYIPFIWKSFIRIWVKSQPLKFWPIWDGITLLQVNNVWKEKTLWKVN